MPDMPGMTKAARASEDAYTLVRAITLSKEAADIRKDKKRFAAAVKYIKKEN